MNLIEKFENKVLTKIKWQIVLLLLILFILITILLLTPITPIGKFLLKNFNNVVLPDLTFGYNYTEIYKTFETMGVIGRSDYLRNLYLIDIIFPIIHTLFLFTLIGFIIQKSDYKIKIIKLFCLIPLLACVIDLIENIFETILVLSFPDLNHTLVFIASGLTITKHSLLNISYLSIPVFLIILIIRLILRKNKISR